MNDHYYTQDPHSKHDIRTFDVEVCGVHLDFETDAGVFSRNALDDGTRILLEALPELRGRVLDLCCGWGAIGIALKKKDPALDVVMTDINERAVELTKRNLARNQCEAFAVQGDALSNVEGLFDAIITNPPIRAGKAVIYDLFLEARDRLQSDGALYIVIRKQQGAPSCVKFLREHFQEVQILDRSKGYWVIVSRNSPIEC